MQTPNMLKNESTVGFLFVQPNQNFLSDSIEDIFTLLVVGYSENTLSRRHFLSSFASVAFK